MPTSTSKNSPTTLLTDSRCYLVVNTKNSYQLSEEYCNNIGGHLASIQNGYENSYLAGQCSFTVFDLWYRGGTKRNWVQIHQRLDWSQRSQQFPAF